MKNTQTATTTYTKQQVIASMKSALRDHPDFLFGYGVYDEVNCTALAEYACTTFKAWGSAPHYEIPEDFFEWSFEVSQWYESTIGRF